MTLRFLVVLGNPEQLSGVRKSISMKGLSPFEISPGAAIWVSDPERTVQLGDRRGVVMGPLFYRHGPPQAIGSLETSDVSAILATQGRHLIDRFWGSYVAVLPTADGHLVLRDPSGMSPCHYALSGGLCAFGSDPDILVETGLAEPRIDWQGLARALYLPGLPGERSALVGIHDVLPGMSVSVRRGSVSTQVYWNPWSHVALDRYDDIERSSEHLRRAVQNCVSGWGNTFGPGVVGISGGLDSSIVAACLERAGKLSSCLTLVTSDPLGDERHYCRALTSHLGVSLNEAYYALADVCLDRSSVSHRSRPFGRLDALAYDAAATKVTRQAGVSAFFTGNGGDNVFFLSRSSRALADRYLCEGLSFRLGSTAQDICKLTGASLPQLLKHGIQTLRLADSAYVWRADGAFLSEVAIRDQQGTPVDHPWLVLPSEGGLPGKAAHIAMLMRMQHSIEGYVERGGFAVVHPLVSQPIVELCLAIPTWQQCKGGVDRAIARRAFASALPLELVERRGKGSPQGFAFEIFRHFHAQIRERLLDGQLVQHDILDRVALETALAPAAQHDSSAMLRLSLLVDTEAWISHWRGKRQTETSMKLASNM